MEILLQKSYAITNFYPERSLICLHLIEKVDFQDLKKTLNQLIKWIAEKEVLNLLIDYRYVEEATIEERAWFVSQWFPKLQNQVSTGFKLGIISSKNLFERMGNQYMVSAMRTQSQFPVHFLESMQDGLQWIEQT